MSLIGRGPGLPEVARVGSRPSLLVVGDPLMKKQGRRPKHIPQRTCVVCRQKTDKRRLTRLVRLPVGRVVVDLSGKQNGRGAYICDQPACWDKLLRDRGILQQALQTPVDDEELAAMMVYKPSSMDHNEPDVKGSGPDTAVADR